MRFFLLLTLLATMVIAWSEQDKEIFQLQSLLKTHSPDSNSFYDLLSIPSSSTTKAISKRFKKLTLLHHPDKIGTHDKTNNEYYEFLQLAATVLRDGEKRKTYDYYLGTGFPKYTGKGWGFYKFKPGTIFAFSVVLALVGTFHYAILWINYNAQTKRIEQLINEVKSLDRNPTDFKEKRVIHPALNKEFMIRIDGVFMVEKTGNWDDFKENFVKLDPNEVRYPNWRDSLFVKLPVAGWNSTIGKLGLKIVLTVPENKPKRKDIPAPVEEKKKTKKVAKRLPNGKIVYKNK